MDFLTQISNWMNQIHLLWIGIGTLLAMWIFPPLRWILEKILSPSGTWILRIIFQWLIWAMKKLIRAHLIYFRNLLLPRSKIYPTLEKSERRN
ncbi:hypothetical protein Atep_29960 (plasmid) [Allochromatium tepidum]|uniref:Uncharacterized protein n=1 Tax=Allochromatium tepidum TaxID=553982 RepID=A0ABM7QRE3_9GAMM|nr:hypothetical protein Atep_29960 [Allochromatium tepidum]